MIFSFTKPNMSEQVNDADATICKVCGKAMCGIECGDVCVNCFYYEFVCPDCGTFSKDLVRWTVNDGATLPSNGLEIIKIDEDNGVFTRWYAPPYRFVDYIDDQTVWVFYCAECRCNKEAHCD